MNTLKLSSIIKGVALFIVVLFFLAFVQANAQEVSYKGVNAGFFKSTSDFNDPLRFTLGAEGQKQVTVFDNQQLRFRGTFAFNSHPTLPTIFQEGRAGSEQKGDEIVIRGTAEYSPIKLGAFRPFLGGGFEYFHQRFPQEPNGNDAHFHSGLNPLATAGVTFGETTKHWLGVTRRFQEVKTTTYRFDTGTYEADEDEYYFENRTHKGTFNPSYLSGWEFAYRGVYPLNRGFVKDVLVGGSIERLTYRECSLTGRGNAGAAFCDGYYERDVVGKVTLGFTF